MDRAVAMGMRVIRTWAFFDVGSRDGSMPTLGNHDMSWEIYLQYWDPVAKRPVVREEGLRGLDYVIAAAKARGLKVILPLVNNWADYGGMDQYATWYGLQYHDQFYTDARTREAYRAYVHAVVTRTNTITGQAYRDDPTIFAWELANEPRCFGSGPDGANPGLPTSQSCTAETIVSWAREMSDYVRSLDPSHMISVGDEGFIPPPQPGYWPYWTADGIDHEALTRLPNVDFGTVHMYPGHFKPTLDWVPEYIAEHGRMAAAIGKPVILEEFGLQDEAIRVTAYPAWLDAAREAGFAGWTVWMVAGTYLGQGLYPDYDGFTIHGDDATSDALRSAAQQTNARP